MGNLNAFFNSNNFKSTNATNLASSGLNIANSFLSSGGRNDDVWSAGGNLGSTGFSNVANQIGSMAGQFGPYGLAAQAGLQSISSLTDLFAYDPEVDPLENTYSSDSLPSFDLSDEAASTNDFIGDFNKSSNKKIASATIGGAATGAAVGGPIGAAIGGVGGLVGGLIGKSSAKKKAEEAQRQMKQEYSGAIGRFNEANKGFYNRENAMQRYQANKQSQSSMFNIPSGSPYFYL